MKRLVAAVALAAAALGGTAAAAPTQTAQAASHPRIILYVHNGRPLAWIDELGGGRGRMVAYESDARWHIDTGTISETGSRLSFTYYLRGTGRLVARYAYRDGHWEVVL